MSLSGSSSASGKALPPIDVEAGTTAASAMRPTESSTTMSPKFSSEEGFRVMFHELSFSVPSHHDKKTKAYLLNNVSGFFQPQQMTALMGPSGSGKTTLLDLLAGRKTTGAVEGRISINGEVPTQQFLRRYTGYVEQFDTLIGSLSVYEMLLYTAELKRPMEEPLVSKKAAVEQLLDKLALQTCRDVRIGNPLKKGISGGQAKRTNIGIALITNPKVLFMDEPTSGLDSYTANEVMTVVKGLLSDGTTICATIHSPSSYCFELFDRVLILVRGELVYFGDLGTAASQYAKLNWQDREVSGKLHMRSDNQAEWLINLVTDADREGKGHVLAEAYEKSDLKEENDILLTSYLEEKHLMKEESRKQLSVKTSTATAWWWEILTLVKYRSLRNYTEGEWLGSRIGDKVVLALIILTLYLSKGNDFGADNLVNLTSVLFMWVVLPAFGAASYLPSIVLERPLFVRERSDGLYRVASYLAFKMVEEIVLSAGLTLGVAAFVFYGVQFSGSYVLFWLVYFVTLCNGIALAYLVASLSPNMDAANAILPAFVTTLLFFAGQLATFSTMPSYWKWYSYLDFVKYSWTALMVNQFSDNDIPYIGNTTILGYFGMKNESMWANLGYTSIFFIVYTFLTWLALSYMKYTNR